MRKFNFNAHTTKDLKPIAQALLSSLENTKLIALNGKMGAGKTTFIKAICKELEVMDVVNSPTFSIINQYVTSNNSFVYHFDFYRLEQAEEALDIGLYDYLDSGHLCLMEWPEKIGKLLPKECVYLEIKEDMTTGERWISWEV